MGLDLLIEAWARVHDELPASARLLIAGDGPQRGPLEAQITRLALAGRVQLLGRVTDAALVDLYRAADVGVVPTRSFEGFGLVVIEAAACGTPTIVTEVGGLPEVVSGLDRSLAVPPGDVEALANRLALAAAGWLPDRGETRRFAERFSWQVAADGNRAVIDEAIAHAPARRRMRVVYLDHVAQLSGGEIALLRLLPHLHDVDPHVILAEDGPFADRLVQAGISTEVLPMRERTRNLRKNRVTLRTLPVGAVVSTAIYIVRLAIWLRRLQPDVVHTNSLKSGLYGSVAARLAGIPSVWHVRDRITPDYLPAPAVRLIRSMTRRLPRAVITNSQSTMETLNAEVSRLVRYSVLPEILVPPPIAVSPKSGELVVGVVGRLAPWKGQDLFLRAFAEAFPSGGGRCVLVGSAMFDEVDYERALRELARELDIADRVEFRGFKADVWHELARMDVLVHASLLPEPFGQVILEGMAAGVPVVAPDAGGPAEIVCDDINGLLYRIGDQDALAETLRKLAGDPALRARLIEAGLESAAAYRPEVVVGRLQDVYRDLIVGSRERRGRTRRRGRRPEWRRAAP